LEGVAIERKMIMKVKFHCVNVGLEMGVLGVNRSLEQVKLANVVNLESAARRVPKTFVSD
jgi:hypothetical protein